MREIMFVPDTTRLDNLLQQFRAKRQHAAVLLDEFGGTAGFVTLDNLMAKIVGEVRDPFDKSAPEIQNLPDGSVLVDGLTLIEDVNAFFGLSLRRQLRHHCRVRPRTAGPHGEGGRHGGRPTGSN
jgi:CBS domain containing-hemolysin-like protein